MSACARKACRCAWSRAIRAASSFPGNWRRSHERRQFLAADAGRVPQRHGAIAAQGGHQRGRAFRFQRRQYPPGGNEARAGAAHHGRHGLLRGEPGGVDHGPVAGGSLDCLSDAVHRLCAQRAGGLVSVRRGGQCDSPGRHRHHHHRRVRGRALLMDYLPFTRPSIDEETIAGVAEVLRSGWITSGPCVKQLEQEWSQYFGGRPVRAMGSATGALEIALSVAGVQAGDEVITTPLSWVATANVVLRAGARPVFVDVDAVTRNIDLARMEAAITPKTRALLPVDMAGLPVDRDRLYDIARRRGLRVIEDAAQSMGASWRGQRIGSFGDLVAISFHANKNITTAEGGCLVLTDAAETDLCTRLRLQGVVRLPDGGQEVEIAGGKHNLTDIAARIGLGQMKYLEAFTARRRLLARRYFERFDRGSGR